MLRERRRSVNNKPNRRLDRKSSRGMIYENEELRIRTININAEVERGQSDIRKLRRENYQLRREIWALRDEYDRLDKLLQANRNGVSPHSSNEDENDDDRYDDLLEEYDEESSHSDDCNSCKDVINEDLETYDNNKNNQKTISNNPKQNLHVNFDHLSIVSEENLTISNRNSLNCESPELDEIKMSPLRELQSVIPPLTHFENLSYETLGSSVDSMGRIIKPVDRQIQKIPDLSEEKIQKPKHFFAPLKSKMGTEIFKMKEPLYATINKPHAKLQIPSTFQMGGNLEDLLQAIENVPDSNEDLTIQNCDNQLNESVCRRPDILTLESTTDLDDETRKPYRSEVNMVLDYQNKADKKLEPIASISTKIGFENFTNNEIQSSPPLPPLPVESCTETLKSGILESIDEGIVEENKDCDRSEPDNTHQVQLNGFLEKKLNSSTDFRKKSSRRVSLCYGAKKSEDKQKQTKTRRASIDVISITNDVENSSFPRRHSSHQHRKLSHDSIKLSKVAMNKINKKHSRGSIDNCGVVNHYDSQETSAESTLERGSILNRNSIASSRESSASISTQKSRKISITSHSGGKIPWCGCWGNGCF